MNEQEERKLFEKWWVDDGNAWDTEGSYEDAFKIFKAGRASLATQKAEPVALVLDDGDSLRVYAEWKPGDCLYTSPPSAQAMFNAGLMASAKLVHKLGGTKGSIGTAEAILTLQAPTDMVVMTRKELREKLIEVAAAMKEQVIYAAERKEPMYFISETAIVSRVMGEES
jgi:hypothetical protein